MAYTGTGFSPDQALDDSLIASENNVDTPNMFLTAAKDITEYLNTGGCLPIGMAAPGVDGGDVATDGVHGWLCGSPSSLGGQPPGQPSSARCATSLFSAAS